MQPDEKNVSLLRRICLLLCLSLKAQIVFADQPQNTATDAQRISAALKYVRIFLMEDANARQVFHRREPHFPVAKDYPTLDSCPFKAVVNSIGQSGNAYFESSKHDVVAVPVVAELVMLWTIDAPSLSTLKTDSLADNCGFEYRSFDPENQTSAAIDGFKTTPLSLLFKDWGEYIYRFEERPSATRPHPAIVVAVDAKHRLVQYVIRVRVDGATVYRVHPDVPRHWYVRHAIRKLQEVNAQVKSQIDVLGRLGDQAPRFEPNLSVAEEAERRAVELRTNTWAFQKLMEFESSSNKR